MPEITIDPARGTAVGRSVSGPVVGQQTTQPFDDRALRGTMFGHGVHLPDLEEARRAMLVETLEGARRRGARRSDHQRDHRLPTGHLSAAGGDPARARALPRRARTGFTHRTLRSSCARSRRARSSSSGSPRQQPVSPRLWWRRCSGFAPTTRPTSARAPRRPPGAAAAEGGRSPADRIRRHRRRRLQHRSLPERPCADGRAVRRRQAPRIGGRAQGRRRRRRTTTLWRPRRPARETRRGRRARPSQRRGALVQPPHTPIGTVRRPRPRRREPPSRTRARKPDKPDKPMRGKRPVEDDPDATMAPTIE